MSINQNHGACLGSPDSWRARVTLRAQLSPRDVPTSPQEVPKYRRSWHSAVRTRLPHRHVTVNQSDLSAQTHTQQRTAGLMSGHESVYFTQTHCIHFLSLPSTLPQLMARDHTHLSSHSPGGRRWAPLAPLALSRLKMAPLGGLCTCLEAPGTSLLPSPSRLVPEFSSLQFAQD